MDEPPIEHDSPCPACGYNLRGLSGNNPCPECGFRRFNMPRSPVLDGIDAHVERVLRRRRRKRARRVAQDRLLREWEARGRRADELLDRFAALLDHLEQQRAHGSNGDGGERPR